MYLQDPRLWQHQEFSWWEKLWPPQLHESVNSIQVSPHLQIMEITVTVISKIPRTEAPPVVEITAIPGMNFPWQGEKGEENPEQPCEHLASIEVSQTKGELVANCSTMDGFLNNVATWAAGTDIGGDFKPARKPVGHAQAMAPCVLHVYLLRVAILSKVGCNYRFLKQTI